MGKIMERKLFNKIYLEDKTSKYYDKLGNVAIYNGLTMKGKERQCAWRELNSRPSV